MPKDAIAFSNTQDVKKYLEKTEYRHIKLGWTDMDGIIRGKYVNRDKFLSALNKGFGFCDVVVGWDTNDVVYPSETGIKSTGWHTAFPDMNMRIVPESGRSIPFEDDLPFFICEADNRDLCPRGVLKRVLDKANDMGFKVNAGIEYEFFVFNETPETIREKGYKNLTPFTPGNFGYSIIRNTTYSELYHEILDVCDEMNVPIEGLHTETGPGVLEAAIEVSEAMEAADRAAIFKTFVKSLLQRNGLMATFMAKYSNDEAGQSGHTHISMNSIKTGESVFYDEDKDAGISDTMRYFIGGQQALMPEFGALISPTVNSYTRLVPGAWAPVKASWGIENRTCALRVITGSKKTQRVEYRVTAADVNPYLGLAAAVSSGLWGIENKIEPSAPMVGNAYEQEMDSKYKLPANLWDAAQMFKNSKPAREMLGDVFVDHFAATREWEEQEFRKHVTDWELERYFEII